MPKCVYAAFCCYHESCDCDDIVFLCNNQSECLCLRSQACLAVDHASIGCGCNEKMKEDECCKIAMPCCSYSCVTPSTLCAFARTCLCFKLAGSLPCHEDYLKDCMCACYFLQCAPKCECCAEPPECKALDELQRGQQPIMAQTMKDRE